MRDDIIWAAQFIRSACQTNVLLDTSYVRERTARLLAHADKIDRQLKAINAACKIIEMGDDRLMAEDGPIDGQPPRLTLDEWRKLYTLLDGARK